MCWLRVVVPVFLIRFSFCYSFSDEEKGVVDSMILQLKPHQVLFATDREAFLSVQIWSNFVLSQWINDTELEDRCRGLVNVASPTMVVVQSDIAQNYLNVYHALKNAFFRSPGGPFNNTHTYVIIQTKQGPELDLKSFRVAYDCEFYYIKPITDSDFEITEKYNWLNVDVEFPYGTWSPSKGLTVPNADFYGRRMNLNGIRLLVSKAWGICEPVVCMQREIWNAISVMMNITSMESIFNQDVRIHTSVSSITGTEFNTDVQWQAPPPRVGPIYNMRIYMHVKRIGKEAAGWRQFFKPFHASMWLAVAALILIATAASVFMHFFSGARLEPAIFFHPLAVFSNQGENSFGQTDSVRVASISTTVTAMVVIPVYSAAVLSAIMVSVEKLPFFDLQGLTEQTGYKIAGVYGKFSYDYMKMEEKYQTIVENFFVKNMPQTLNEGLERLCTEDKFVFLGYNNFVLNDPALKCRVLKIPNYLFSSPVSFTLKNGSPFVKVFNRNLIKLHSSGILKKLAKEAAGAKPAEEDEDGNASAVQLPHVLFPIYVMSAGVFISVALLLAEVFSACLCKRAL